MGSFEILVYRTENMLDKKHTMDGDKTVLPEVFLLMAKKSLGRGVYTQ